MSEQRCETCGIELTVGSAVWITADGAKRRKNPVCQSCHEAAVRGLGRAAAHVSRTFDKQRQPGAAYREYDG